ncbi:capsular polysaccharide biosynthesis protein [Vibrio owensii]|uniref:capsular polysaccharide biosynthesis protein n=1 Tax=Vibrio owensii TaxID=696485 RepID=UPI0018F20DE9|nr:capsular polysaccharide biosynthesis protein [Vibrio owensii]
MSERNGVVLASALPLKKIELLAEVFGAERIEAVLVGRKRKLKKKSTKVAVGWGMKPAAIKLKERAIASNVPFYHLEDGFIGFDTHPAKGGQRLSLVLDDKGLYYDCSKASRLEEIVQLHDEWMNEKERERANVGMRVMRQYGISKYNSGSKELPLDLKYSFMESGDNILVVDQVCGDLSVSYSGASESSFIEMLDAAINENPSSNIFIKVHPDVLNGKKKSYLTDIARHREVELISEDVIPQVLLPNFKRVYAVSSFVGFEALMFGVDVTLFGMPFYGGWGLTDDRLSAPDRRKNVSGVTLEALFAAAYFKYPVYIDPITGKVSSFERIISYLTLKRFEKEYPTGDVYVENFSPWKRKFIKSYLSEIMPGSKVRFKRGKVNTNKLTPEDTLLVWGHREDHEFTREYNIMVCEDGFIRSCGLGSDLNYPSSLCFDLGGIHFDAFGGSELESILAHNRYNEIELKYASKLIESLNKANISKYNVGVTEVVDYSIMANGRKIILVVGQVEGDKSIKYSTSEHVTNYELVHAVRKDNPDAFIVYKPHPDVVSKNRPRETNREKLISIIDHEERDVSINSMFDAVDEVHLISSLTGFEALLRGKSVYCYGMPFYAGWGLTTDKGFKPIWRDRNLSLEEVVLGALKLYPEYIDWGTQRKTEVESLIEAWGAGARTSYVNRNGKFFTKVKNVIGGAK